MYVYKVCLIKLVLLPVDLPNCRDDNVDNVFQTFSNLLVVSVIVDKEENSPRILLALLISQDREGNFLILSCRGWFGCYSEL